MGTDTPYGQHLSPYYMMHGDDEQGQEALLIEIEMDDTHTTTDHNKDSSLSSSDMIMKSTEQNKRKGILRQLQSNTINKSNIFNNKNGRTHDPKASTKKFSNHSTMRMVMLLSTEKYNRHTSDADLSQQMLRTALSNTSKSNEDNIVKEEMIVSALQNVSNEDNMSALQQNARWLLSQAKQHQEEKHQQEQPQRYPRIMKKYSKNRKNTNSDQEDLSLLIFRPGSTHHAKRWIDRKRSQKKKKSNKTKNKKSKWQSAIDPQSGKPYYYHRFSKKTTWTKPLDFDHDKNCNPPIVEWTTQMDIKTGRMCYTNLTTNETTFTRPGNDSSDDQHDNKSSLSSEMMTNSTSSSSSVMINDFSDDDGYYSDEVSNSDGLVGSFDGMVVF